MIKPHMLREGDIIGLTAPSGPVEDTGIVDQCIAKLNELGFKVKVGESCYSKYGYLAGSDNTRADDLNSMFAEKDINGIICLKGGYGTSRIIDKLDYEVIKENPKVFIGYSDITSIHLAINKLCGFITFHGPMAASDMVPELDEFSECCLMKAISNPEPLGEIRNPAGQDIRRLFKGKASGPIIGGNLSLIAATLGTPYEIDTSSKLLFIEDTDEEPYRIDRMLSQLRLAGKFEDCCGVIIGDWNNCKPVKSDSLTLMDIYKDIIIPCGKPAIFNVKAGHCIPKITIPFGAKAILDADMCMLKITESALTAY